MVIDSKGKLFEERRKKNRRKDERPIADNKRKDADRRDSKNAYKVEKD